MACRRCRSWWDEVLRDVLPLPAIPVTMPSIPHDWYVTAEKVQG